MNSAIKFPLFPMSFKPADVKPLHKISKKVYDDNFRSVFILITLSKTL